MEHFAKLLLLSAAALGLLGAAIWIISKLGYRGLPGDIVYRKEGWTIVFPITTCLLISLLATLALKLWHWLQDK